MATRRCERLLPHLLWAPRSDWDGGLCVGAGNADSMSWPGLLAWQHDGGGMAMGGVTEEVSKLEVASCRGNSNCYSYCYFYCWGEDTITTRTVASASAFSASARSAASASHF